MDRWVRKEQLMQNAQKKIKDWIAVERNRVSRSDCGKRNETDNLHRTTIIKKSFLVKKYWIPKKFLLPGLKKIRKKSNLNFFMFACHYSSLWFSGLRLRVPRPEVGRPHPPRVRTGWGILQKPTGNFPLHFNLTEKVLKLNRSRATAPTRAWWSPASPGPARPRAPSSSWSTSARSRPTSPRGCSSRSWRQTPSWKRSVGLFNRS